MRDRSAADVTDQRHGRIREVLDLDDRRDVLGETDARSIVVD